MLVIDNGTIFTENHLVKGHLIIDKGLIQGIYPNNFDKTNSDFNDALDKYIDAKNGLILPGFIDVHVHFRDMNQKQKETINSGSKGAIRAGVTSVLTMPNTDPPLSTVANIQKYKEIIVKQSPYCNVGLYMTIKKGFTLEKMPEMIDEGICGIKIYPGDSTEKFPLEWETGWRSDLYPEEFESEFPNILKNFQKEYQNWQKLFTFAKKENLPVLFHPEFPRDEKSLDTLIDQGLIIAENEHARNPHLFAHHVSHPVFTNEMALVEMIIAFLHKFFPNPKDAPHVHFVHVSSGDVVDVINSMLRKKGYTCSIEVSPHHLYLNYDLLVKNENFGKVLVPLRSPEIQENLRMKLNSNSVDIIGTDHAPHTLDEKSKSFKEAPSGFPSIEIASRIFLSEVFREKLPLKELVSLYSTKPAKILGLHNKGSLTPGYDADFVVVRQVDPYKIQAEKMLGAQKWTPWEDYEVCAEIEQVFIKGNLAFKRETNLFSPHGTYLHPSKEKI